MSDTTGTSTEQAARIPPTQNRFERRRKLWLTVVVSVMTLLIIGADLAAGQLVKAGNARNPNKGLRVPSPIYHHGFAPNKHVISTWGDSSVDFFTNSLGLRDAEIREVENHTDKHRILIVGDSFAEADGIPYEQTFAGLVAQALADRGVEALNAGVGSYSAIVYWRKTLYLLDEVGIDVDQVVVFLDISDVWDAHSYALNSDGNVVKARPLKRLQDFIQSNTLMLGKLSRHAYRLYQRARWWGTAERDNVAGDTDRPGTEELPASLALNHHHTMWTLHDDAFEDWGKAGLALETTYMNRLHDALDERGIPLTIVVYPWPDQIWSGDLESRQSRHWGAWAKERGAGFVDLFPDFVTTGSREARRSSIERHYIEGDVHWNSEGHRLVADVLLDHLTVP